ncbi:hypothetical protein Tco_1017485 [Tanacetum coccineum]|uniref:Integrase, catalytic region, zinc finger, CCHC-type, peptidase aspartic, catalytic n=1 Tax=Tanacetum coccineum TaxID=301880 RepID=A0ABQ5FRN2_9ASTR
MLLAGSELTKEDRESQLYDEFKRFKMLPGENINEYYVRFHKLVNDMRNIIMTMPNIQLNSKFVNNMSPEWDSVQPYAQLSHAQSHQYPSSSTPLQSPHVQSLQYTQFVESSHLDSGYIKTDEILDTLTKQGDRIRIRETLLRELVHQEIREHKIELDKMLLMQAQENGAVLDEEELLFLADECDAFDSDVDDEPTAQSIFMASLSFAGPVNLQADPSNASILSEVHDLDNAIDPSTNDQVEHEIHNEVQQKNVIDSTSANMGNSNVIPYEQYLTVNDVFVVPSSASSVPNNAYVLHDNDEYVPHDPLATELNIFKE